MNGWGEGSVSTALANQVSGTEFRSPVPVLEGRNDSTPLKSQCWVGDKQI